MINKEEAIEWARRLDPKEAFCAIPYTFLQFLRPTAALMLAHIINFWRMGLKGNRERERHDRRWVQFPEASIHKYLNYTPKMTRLCLTQLKKIGVVHISKMGNPAKRWMSPDLPTLQHRIDSVQGPNSQDAQKGKLQDAQKGVTKSCAQKGVTLSIRMKKEDKEHCRDCVATEWGEIGLQLGKAMKQAGVVMKTAKPGAWGNPIRLLHTEDGVPLKAIMMVLNWYCTIMQHEGDLGVVGGNPNFLPVVESGQSFRNKFDKLEMARKKHEMKHGKTPQWAKKKSVNKAVRKEDLSPEEQCKLNEV